MQETYMGSQPHISTRTTHKPSKRDLKIYQGAAKDQIWIETGQNKGLTQIGGVKQGFEAQNQAKKMQIAVDSGTGMIRVVLM